MENDKMGERGGGVWQQSPAWDDFVRLGRSAGVYPRRILAGAAANPDTSGPGIKPDATDLGTRHVAPGFIPGAESPSA